MAYGALPARPADEQVRFIVAHARRPAEFERVQLGDFVIEWSHCSVGLYAPFLIPAYRRSRCASPTLYSSSLQAQRSKTKSPSSLSPLSASRVPLMVKAYIFATSRRTLPPISLITSSRLL